MSGPVASLLPDGRRLHLQHGPIDLVVEAWGKASAVARGYDRAAHRFATVLDELVAELPALRRPAGAVPRCFAGAVARRMEAAVQPLARECQTFLTPMAAVAGAVAEEVLAALTEGGELLKAYVNNGGDAALHFGQASGTLRLAIAGTGRADRLTVRAQDKVRGVATSGWRGRSFSLGIADAVTVLAAGAAAADAAATLIANAVDLGPHHAVSRARACDLSPDSDLGERLVTTGVGALSAAGLDRALENGLAVAESLRQAGRIKGAALFLAGECRLCGAPRLVLPGEADRESAMREAALA